MASHPGRQDNHVPRSGEQLHMSNREIMQDHARMMADQDEELAQLEGTVGNLNHMSNAISNEISLHNDLLDGLNSQASHTQEGITHSRGRLTEVLTRHNNCGLWCLIIILIVALVALLNIIT